MVSITLSIPEDIKKKMETFPEINWSGLVRTIIMEKIERLTWKKEMLKNFEEESWFNDWAVNTIRDGRKNKK
ncbi:MAG: hypothetical protein AABW89_02060 [Nanoarchaeota archaeon]